MDAGLIFSICYTAALAVAGFIGFYVIGSHLNDEKIKEMERKTKMLSDKTSGGDKTAPRSCDANKTAPRSCADCSHRVGPRRCALYGPVNDEEPCERFLLRLPEEDRR